MLIGCYNKSVILTYLGVITSLFGMLATKNINIQMICLVIAGICDMFDGTIARMCKRTNTEKKFGVQIWYISSSNIYEHSWSKLVELNN